MRKCDRSDMTESSNKTDRPTKTFVCQFSLCVLKVTDKCEEGDLFAPIWNNSDVTQAGTGLIEAGGTYLCVEITKVTNGNVFFRW